MVTRRFHAVALAAAFAACGDSETTSPGPTPPPELDVALRPHDVSILFPLPKPSDRTKLLGGDVAGAHGELLPRRFVDSLPTLQLLAENKQLYELMRVVGIRLDPCFPTLDRSNADGCKSQVRLVLQPVKPADVEGKLVLTTVDTAVHVFYSVPEDELEELLAWVVDARRSSLPDDDTLVLGVHPALAAEGIEGPFAQALRSHLLDAIGEDNLTRVTFMTLGDFGNVWSFGGFDVQGGELVPFAIATTNSYEQTFANLDSTGAAFASGESEPPGETPDDIRLWLDSEAAIVATPEAQRAAYESLLHIENPAFHRPDTIDCVSCHVAPAARRWVEQSLDLESLSADAEYLLDDGSIVPGATVERTDELRMFGYFDTRPSISQRTANETHALVGFWNAELGLD